MTQTELCKAYLSEIDLLSKRLSYYYDVLFYPASEYACLCEDIDYIDRQIISAELKQSKIASLKEKQLELLEKISKLEKEMPNYIPSNLNKIKELAKEKMLNNDELCKALSTPKKQCTWQSFFDIDEKNGPRFRYGLKFVKGTDEIHCFFGVTTSRLKAEYINKKLKSINWYDAITDFRCRDKYRTDPTCFRIPQEIQKAVLKELSKSTTKTFAQVDAERGK